MADREADSLNKGRPLRIILLALAGGVIGAGGSVYLDRIDFPEEDAFALLIAVALLAGAVMGGVMVAMRSPDIPKDCGVLQVLVMALAGAMLAAPVLAPAALPEAWVYGAIVLLFLVQTVANIVLWRTADELLRRVMADTSVVSFWLLQGALFLYAAGERLGLFAHVTAWTMTVILMAVYLLASAYVSLRRGLG